MSEMLSRNITCKYCETQKVVKSGSYNGTSRYFCKLCWRKFKDDNHASHMRVLVTYIDRILHLFYSGMHLVEKGHRVTVLEMLDMLASKATPIHYYSMFRDAWGKLENFLIYLKRPLQKYFSGESNLYRCQ